MQQPTLSHTYHPRSLDQNRYVYAVLSRRSGGVSIGINLNPDKICNFDCVYCQVDRHIPGTERRVDLRVLEHEVIDILARAKSGSLFAEPPFRGIDPALQKVTDIALSGDGEPTTCPEFEQVVKLVIRAKQQAGLDRLKIVVITNATMCHRPAVKRALALLDEHQGEIWAKLDAGTEDYYRVVDVTTIPFQRILDNILDAARRRPIVIQSLFARLHGKPPELAEVDAYLQRLKNIVNSGGQVKLVQVHTVARAPAQPYVSALSDSEVDHIAGRVRSLGIPAATYYGAH